MERIGALDSLKITVLAEDSVLYESPYLGQHGISFLLAGTSGEKTKRILIDVGYNPEALLSNMRIMGILPSSIDAIVLTHCHYDHTWGIVNILGEIDKKDTKIIAHQCIFRPHFITQPYLRHTGMTEGNSKAEIERAGGNLLLSKDSISIMPGLLTTGEVKRITDFEKVSGRLKTCENGVTIDDPMLDDISVVALVKNKGLIIITGCSHAGIVNISKQAIELTGCNKIDAIVGGLHLVEASDDVINTTVGELSKLKVERVITGHCTGFKAQVKLYLTFGDRFLALQTGVQLDWT